MGQQYTWETCSRVIQSEVRTLQTESQRLLGENLVGFYLHGSLALGGFNPTRSDVNIIAVTRQRMDTEVKRSVVTLLLRISKMPCPIDIYYLAVQDVFPFQQPLPYDLHYSETWRERNQQDLHNGTWKHWNDSVHHEPDLTIFLTVLQYCGVCLYGEEPVRVLPAVPEQEFRNAVITHIQALQQFPLHDPISFVLNACRVAAYLRDGTILSKDAGGMWGLDKLPGQYHPLIQQLLALYRGERPGRPVGRVALNDFATYVQQTIVIGA